MILDIFSHTYHWFEVSTKVALSGVGYTHAFSLYSCSQVNIVFTVVTLTESLEVWVCLLNDTNPIVARMARIVITIISSTKVKAFLFWEETLLAPLSGGDESFALPWICEELEGFYLVFYLVFT